MPLLGDNCDDAPSADGDACGDGVTSRLLATLAGDDRDDENDDEDCALMNSAARAGADADSSVAESVTSGAGPDRGAIVGDCGSADDASKSSWRLSAKASSAGVACCSALDEEEGGNANDDGPEPNGEGSAKSSAVPGVTNTVSGAAVAADDEAAGAGVAKAGDNEDEDRDEDEDEDEGSAFGVLLMRGSFDAENGDRPAALAEPPNAAIDGENMAVTDDDLQDDDAPPPPPRLLPNPGDRNGLDLMVLFGLVTAAAEGDVESAASS